MVFRVWVCALILTGFIALVPRLAVAQLNDGAQNYAESIKSLMMPNAYEPLTIQTASGKRYDFKVELADTPTKSMHGLMNRKSMPDRNGMLFLFFDGERERSFWMKNTLIPLDIIFIRSDGTIHRVHDSAKPLDETVIKSKGDVCCALELNGGTAKMLEIKAGDVVTHRAFRNNLAK